jgi:hypothetical protein
MTEYEKYLRGLGASDDEVKVLVNPTSERAYTKMQADLAKANGAVTAYKNWFDNEAVPAYKKMETELVVTRANEARARTALVAAQERGLINLTKDLGYEVDPAKVPPPVGGTPPDLSRYVTLDQLKTVAEGEGDAIAAAYDIGREHVVLFPDKALNMRALRTSAIKRGVSVEQEWMETYGVQTAREARTAKIQADRDETIRKEAYDKARTEFADTYGNPSTRPLVSSNSPFTPRPAAGRDKQPWEVGDRSNDRVRRATASVVERFAGGAPVIPGARPN